MGIMFIVLYYYLFSHNTSLVFLFQAALWNVDVRFREVGGVKYGVFVEKQRKERKYAEKGSKKLSLSLLDYGITPHNIRNANVPPTLSLKKPGNERRRYVDAARALPIQPVGILDRRSMIRH
jgi:hypothetical protein